MDPSPGICYLFAVPKAEKPLALTLYNTLARAKQPFEPLDAKNVRMYVCGPTVYDFAHIGNARPVVVFDVLYRLLRHGYGEDHVTYARNITDVDDKIIAAAGEAGEDIGNVTTRYSDAFHADMAALGALPPDIEPRATDHIPEMIALMETLIAREHAYEADGHVLFAVNTMTDYGRLSRHSRDELIAGARVEIAPYKKDPADFVLWKPSTADQPGWESPWGRGRPGWHLECSAMSEKHLGPRFDIHGGGLDLIFPHHENEIAQSACAHEDHEFVKYWVHNGYLTVDGEKMSKSLGNFFTVRELLAKAPGEAIRFALLTTQYRKPLDWTDARMRDAVRTLNRCYQVLWRFQTEPLIDEIDPPEKFLDALEDDLNTPLAISVLVSMTNKFNEISSSSEKSKLKSQLLACGKILGIFNEDPDEWRKGRRDKATSWMEPSFTVDELGEMLTQDLIDQKIEQRNEARKKKNFAESDRIRDELTAAGVVLEDGPEGTTWRRA